MQPDQTMTNLRELMAEHNLKSPDVARLLGVKPQTVRAWASPTTPRHIPNNLLDLLRYKLAEEIKDHLRKQSLDKPAESEA